MSEFDWNDEKSESLEKTRGICFEDVVILVQNGHVIKVIKHPNKDRYPKQNIMVLDVEGYIYLVPYVKSQGIRFLKTIIPSRKATREYLS
jgi:uncharacterized DUF497 family protein